LLSKDTLVAVPPPAPLQRARNTSPESGSVFHLDENQLYLPKTESNDTVLKTQGVLQFLNSVYSVNYQYTAHSIST
jgi:hypothetical protein